MRPGGQARATAIVVRSCDRANPPRVWFADPKANGWLAAGSMTSPRYIKLDEHADGPSTSNRTGWCIRGAVYLNPLQPAGEHYQGFAFDPRSGALRSSVCVGLQCLIAPANGTAAHTGRCGAPRSGGWTQDFEPSRPR